MRLKMTALFFNPPETMSMKRINSIKKISLRYFKVPTCVFFLLMLIGVLKAQQFYPTIIIDDAHNHLLPGADRSVIYTVSESKGIVIDASAYDFGNLKKHLNGKEPDKIFVVMESGTFMADFAKEKKMVLDKHSLTPLLGNDTFHGFRKGDAPVIAIGTVVMQGKTPRMAQIWATTIRITR
jgi:hypothetical protein